MRDSGLRDPDLLGRAQRAATELERASDRWHALHGVDSEPMPAVSGYVGYSLERPEGQPRVVFRIEANQAEQLAALLDGHDCTAAVDAGRASARGTRSGEDPAARWEAARREPVPRQPACAPAAPQPLRRPGTPGRHAAGKPAAASAGTAQGAGALRYAWQAHGAAAQALAESQDDTGPQGYPLQRHGGLYAVPSEPNSDLRAGRSRAAQYPQGQDYATALREAAEKEAAAIRQQAAEQAASLTRAASQEAARIREAAEQEAAQMRAALAAMSGEMGRVAAYVSENLTVPAIPAVRPAETPATRPARPSALRAMPAAPAKEPAKRTRQQNAMRVSKFAIAAGLLGVAAAASTEFALHGPSFFVFRQSGTGETPGNFSDQDFLAKEQAKPVKPKPQVVKRAAKPARHAPKASP